MATAKPPEVSARTFGISLGVVCLLWAAVLFWRGKPMAAAWLAGISPALLLIAWLAPGVLRPVQAVWMPVAHRISAAVTWLLLTSVFVVAFIPYGVIARALGKDPLERKIDRKRSSYWILRDERRPDSARLDKQY